MLCEDAPLGWSEQLTILLVATEIAVVHKPVRQVAQSQSPHLALTILSITRVEVFWNNLGVFIGYNSMFIKNNKVSMYFVLITYGHV